MGRAAEQANTALPKGGGRHLHPLKLAKKDLITLAKCLPDGTGLLPSPQRQPSSSEQTMCSNSRSVTPRSRDPEPSFKLGYFFKHYSACERCRLAEIKFNQSRASLAYAGLTRSPPVMDVPPPAASPSPPSPPPARPPLEPPSASPPPLPPSHQRRPQRGRRRSPSPPSPPPLPPSASPPPSHQHCASPGALNCAG